ncbi:DUF2628 domain-containing protein [Devosia ginsengisoli]|uniref:DUF2628 domain-containing protein n=1 Tax=Devosia ginsengisoli TaxID=400770 RepID=UPI0026F076AD|nr:DUF2628 domain-containing protein [Devosia ginsengisoli]MCR6671093.1 DUF2628 domain-containing protein [Devosia ginsengisoli]
MTLYAIFDPKQGKPALPAAVPEKFSWFAAILPPLFLVAHGLWLELVAWVLKVVALVVLSRFIGGDTTFLLYALAAIWLGFAAPGLRRHALTWRGWTHRGERVAVSADMAQLEALQ